MYFKGVNPIKAFLLDPELAWNYFVKSGIRVAYAKFTEDKLRLKHYGGGKVLNNLEANLILKDKIFNEKSFMFGRFGSIELSFVTEALLIRKRFKKEYNFGELSQSCINCGLFPQDKEVFLKFADMLLETSKEADVQGVFRMILEDYYIKKYLRKDILLTNLNMLDFWQYDIPFTSALKGKKVLVIHPLAKTIESQYNKREKLFKNENILPEFSLKTLKAIQTSGGAVDNRFKDWFEALKYMHEETLKIDFDIALIGCGAYGIPLASLIKQDGKSSIYMGGVTQMLFGIKGARWDSHPIASRLYNEFWVYPMNDDVPENANKVENRCYW